MLHANGTSNANKQSYSSKNHTYYSLLTTYIIWDNIISPRKGVAAVTFIAFTLRCSYVPVVRIKAPPLPPFLVLMCQVLPLPVHPLRPQQHPDRVGPHCQLRRHPHELPGFGGNQAATDQGHAEKAVQGNTDDAGGLLNTRIIVLVVQRQQVMEQCDANFETFLRFTLNLHFKFHIYY